MDFLDRLRGRNDAPDQTRVPHGARYAAGGGTPGEMTGESALERYRYRLRTAPPEDIELAHEEVFATLGPEQRAMALRELAAYVPESERRMASDDPRSLARMATRAEIRQPGTIERAFGGGGGPGAGGGWGGPGLGSIFLTSLAAGFVGSAIAQSFFADHGQGFESGYSEGYQDAAATGEGGGEQGYGEDTGAADYGGGDAGGGDFGGGDFGGGDFGGGDFGGI